MNPTFWNQLLLRSDAIAGIDSQSPDALPQLQAQLATLVEQYRGVFDPADHFEAFVVVDLCKNLERALTAAPTQSARQPQTTTHQPQATTHQSPATKSQSQATTQPQTTPQPQAAPQPPKARPRARKKGR